MARRCPHCGDSVGDYHECPKRPLPFEGLITTKKEKTQVPNRDYPQKINNTLYTYQVEGMVNSAFRTILNGAGSFKSQYQGVTVEAKQDGNHIDIFVNMGETVNPEVLPKF